MEDHGLADGERLLVELHEELLGHGVRVEGLLGDLLPVVKVDGHGERGGKVLLLVEAVRLDADVLVQAEHGPLALHQREAELAGRDALVLLEGEDEPLAFRGHHQHVLVPTEHAPSKE